MSWPGATLKPAFISAGWDQPIDQELADILVVHRLFAQTVEGVVSLFELLVGIVVKASESDREVCERFRYFSHSYDGRLGQ